MNDRVKAALAVRALLNVYESSMDYMGVKDRLGKNDSYSKKKEIRKAWEKWWSTLRDDAMPLLQDLELLDEFGNLRERARYCRAGTFTISQGDHETTLPYIATIEEVQAACDEAGIQWPPNWR